jgi:hypothetical protein
MNDYTCEFKRYGVGVSAFFGVETPWYGIELLDTFMIMLVIVNTRLGSHLT